MDAELKIRQAIVKVADDLGLVDLDFGVEHPRDETHGDFSTNIALVAKMSSDEIKMALEHDSELMKVVDRLEIAGPAHRVGGQGFINFWLREDYLISKLDEVLAKKDNFGKGSWGKGKLYEVEHTSPNPNKAMHLGHLRNNLTGMAIGNLFEAGGVKVIRDCIDNNRGIAIAKLMWGYLRFGRKDKGEKTELKYWYEHQDEWQAPVGAGKRPDIFVDELYVKGVADFKGNDEVEKKVRQMVVDWEAKDGYTWALWKAVLDYSYKGQEMTLKRLGSHWDKVWHESDHYQKGKEWVKEGLKRGVFIKLEDGAVLTDLGGYGLTDTIVQKNDGTALYVTQDIALTELKKQTFHADRLFWVIGPEQSLDLKQMFAVCEQLGIGKVEEFTHVPYGYMSIKGQGKMSSREGNVVYIDQLINAAKERVALLMNGRGFSKKELNTLAEKLALGAVKYSILRVGRLTDMAFDVESSVSFEGNSGPYLNYVYVRTRRVMEKAGGVDVHTFGGEVTLEEMDLLRWIYRFDEVVEVAGKDMSPNLICSYLLELAKRFNNFYEKNPILEGGESKEFRLVLTQAVGQVIKNGLTLLGIEVIERM